MVEESLGLYTKVDRVETGICLSVWLCDICSDHCGLSLLRCTTSLMWRLCPATMPGSNVNVKNVAVKEAWLRCYKLRGRPRQGEQPTFTSQVHHHKPSWSDLVMVSPAVKFSEILAKI